jgi:hypothetical protein
MHGEACPGAKEMEMTMVGNPDVVALSDRRPTDGGPVCNGLRSRDLEGLLEDKVLRGWAEEMAVAKKCSPAVVIAALAIALEQSTVPGERSSLAAG